MYSSTKNILQNTTHRLMYQMSYRETAQKSQQQPSKSNFSNRIVMQDQNITNRPMDKVNYNNWVNIKS